MEEKYREIWNELCYKVQKHKQDEEKIFQTAFEGILEKLHWLEYKGDFEVQPSFKVASNKSFIPDIILKNNNLNVCIIELKRLSWEINEDNRQQVISYMKDRKTQFGILLGQHLELFFDDIIEQKDPKSIFTYNFNENNEDGVKLIELLDKNNFTTTNFCRYCENIIELRNQKIVEREKIDTELKMLCSQNGVNKVKELLSKEFLPETLEQIEVDIYKKGEKTFIPTNPVSVCRPTYSFVEPLADINNTELNRRENETFQLWIKRILTYLYNNNYINDDEENNLLDKYYSSRNLGISYPLFRKIEEGKNKRFWSDFIIGNKYYVCSQWGKGLFPIYERKITNWINELIENKK